MRNLPDPHPIFKLLRPHFRYTMAINTRGRATLINDGGILDKLFAIGGKGKFELIRRASPFTVSTGHTLRRAPKIVE